MQKNSLPSFTLALDLKKNKHQGPKKEQKFFNPQL